MPPITVPVTLSLCRTKSPKQDRKPKNRKHCSLECHLSLLSYRSPDLRRRPTLGERPETLKRFVDGKKIFANDAGGRQKAPGTPTTGKSAACPSQPANSRSPGALALRRKMQMGSLPQMPSAKAKPNRRPAATRNPQPQQRAAPPETVDPRWILKALGAVIALGVLCAYITLCALFYTEQWQLVLHPSRAVPQTPASHGLSFQPLHFADDAAAQPQLTGWWIPSDLPSDPTVLMLHSQDGTMSNALPMANALHNARLNVLLFDYRGYGQSGGRHPTEQTMRSDAESAFTYLTDNRHIPPASLIVYGSGLGASLAVDLCAQHPAIPGLILESADGDTTPRVLHDVHSRIVPAHLLFHERFPLADPLTRLRTPKLLISHTSGPAPLEAQRAADPKILAELPLNAPPAQLAAAIRRFVDTYIHTGPAAR